MAVSSITTQLDDTALARLEQLAARVGRSRDTLAATAINSFVDSELELVASLDEAEAQIERGEFYTQEQVEAWFDVRRTGKGRD